MAKYSYDEVNKMFFDHNMTLVSKEYHNRDEKLDYICNDHKDKGIQHMSLCDLLHGRKCVYCRYENGEPCNFILPEDIYQEETQKVGYKYVGYHKEKNFVYIDFICPIHEDKGVQSSIWNHIKNGRCCCGACNGNNRSTDEFADMVHEKLPHIDVIGRYLGARERVDVKCSVCGNQWSPYAYNLLSGSGCQKCYDNRRGKIHHKGEEEKLNKLEQMHSDIEFLKIPYYARDNVDCRCKVCGFEWSASYTNMTKKTRPTGCPRCDSSKGEKAVMQLLKQWKIQYTTQKTFDDLFDIDYLRFDFSLINNDVLIEYDGEYHYFPIIRENTPDGIISAQNDYDELIKHDKMKNAYCEKNHIALIRIPYWEYDNLDYYLFDELVKAKVINEIA